MLFYYFGVTGFIEEDILIRETNSYYVLRDTKKLKRNCYTNKEDIVYWGLSEVDKHIKTLNISLDSFMYAMTKPYSMSYGIFIEPFLCYSIFSEDSLKELLQYYKEFPEAFI